MNVTRFLSAIAICLLTAGVLAGGAGSDASNPARVPVVVELFTSEGCSSCPPADAMLIDLERQPIPGAEVIVLGEHVDYWNRLGWNDRFSASQFSERQSRYASRFHLESVYTPQMVINGRTEFVGNDTARATKAIADAARPHGVPSIVISAAADSLDVKISNAPRHSLDVILAITESDLSTQVGKGENHGRLLRHTGVVRELRKLGATSGGQFAAQPRIALSPEWRRQNLRAIVFLQEPTSWEIAGAAQVAWK
jgi:hypothetical protein